MVPFITLCSKRERGDLFVKLNSNVCISCEQCLPICPVEAIFLNVTGVAEINDDKCVECGACYRSSNCPTDAFSKNDIPFPRQVRRWFSDNTEKIPTVKSLGSGRGVDEVKTNDKTGYYKKGEVGFVIEPGRPAIAASLMDVQRIVHKMYELGYQLTDRSPLKPLVVNDITGDLSSEILQEKVLSCSLEFKGVYNDIEKMVKAIEQVSHEINTVIAVGVISRVENWRLPAVEILNDLGYETMPNGKVNIGLGRPLVTD